MGAAGERHAPIGPPKEKELTASSSVSRAAPGGSTGLTCRPWAPKCPRETPPPVRLLRGQKVTLFKGLDAMWVRRWGVSNNMTAEKASALPSETELSPSARSYNAALGSS